VSGTWDSVIALRDTGAVPLVANLMAGDVAIISVLDGMHCRRVRAVPTAAAVPTAGRVASARRGLRHGHAGRSCEGDGMRPLGLGPYLCRGQRAHLCGREPRRRGLRHGHADRSCEGDGMRRLGLGPYLCRGQRAHLCGREPRRRGLRHGHADRSCEGDGMRRLGLGPYLCRGQRAHLCGREPRKTCFLVARTALKPLLEHDAIVGATYL